MSKNITVEVRDIPLTYLNCPDRFQFKNVDDGWMIAECRCKIKPCTNSCEYNRHKDVNLCPRCDEYK